MAAPDRVVCAPVVASGRGAPVSGDLAVPLWGALAGALVALVVAEPLVVRITPQRTTPWDAAASSAVVPRHRAEVIPPPPAPLPPVPAPS